MNNDKHNIYSYRKKKVFLEYQFSIITRHYSNWKFKFCAKLNKVV